ncbi:hypothetical protein [Actinomadura bangladeshensis]|nr:hypothetical protein [Actinomadura bangladeshensis]
MPVALPETDSADLEVTISGLSGDNRDSSAGAKIWLVLSGAWLRMWRVDVPRLAPEEVDALLHDLCVRLGFCLPPADQAVLRASPPVGVDSFAEAVFRAEGLDASPDGELWRQVRETVARAFEAGSRTGGCGEE